MAHRRPDPEFHHFTSYWCCPLCNSGVYLSVLIPRNDGTFYKTDFFQCLGCTVMFRIPDKFTRLGIPVRRWANDVGPKTLQDVHGFGGQPVSEALRRKEKE